MGEFVGSHSSFLFPLPRVRLRQARSEWSGVLVLERPRERQP
jgi:hypothetical protein